MGKMSLRIVAVGTVVLLSSSFSPRHIADRDSYGTGIPFFAGKEKIQITPPEQVSVRGDLLGRMHRAIGYLDKASTRDIWDGFSDGIWGADYSGRTLEAYSRVALSTGSVSSRFEEIAYGLLSHQFPDGSFQNGKAKFDFEKSTGFWFGNARGMMGLLWAYKYKKEPRYIESAKKLGDYYVAHYFDKDQPGAPGSFWWVGTEAMYALYQATGEKKYLQSATKIAETIPPVLMISQHTHSYLLSLRGIVQLCEETNNDVLLKKVLQQYAVFKDQVMWPGGGIVEHLGNSEAQNLNYWYDEGCSVDDWLGLNLDLWRTSLDPSYMDMAERVAFNHLLFDQDENGGFCGDRSVDFVREGSPWPFCCAMHGTRTLSELTQYIAMTDGADMYINLFYPSTTNLVIQHTAVAVDLQTNYPVDGHLRLAIKPSEATDFAMKVRVPAWSHVKSAFVNGEKWNGTITGGYLVINRRWKTGDIVEMELDMPLRTEARNAYIGNKKTTDMSEVSLWKGPRQLVYNQELNIHLWKLKRSRPALSYVYQSFDTLQFDKSVKKTPLKIGENSYKKGLGTHTVSEIEYRLDGQFKEFKADIGVDESAGDKGAVRFKVCVDGVVKAGTAVKAGMGNDGDDNVKALYGFSVSAATGKDGPTSIQVNTENAQVLRLVVDDAVNGFENDYANWADARLIRADGSVVYLSDLPDQRKTGSPLDWGKIKLLETADPGQPGNVVSLVFKMPGQKQVPIRFSYLSDLGYSLIAKRPVLDSWVRVDGK